MGSPSALASSEALPMDQEFKQGYRMHRIFSNLNRLDIDRLDDADRERVETARNLLEAFSRGRATKPGQTPTQTPNWRRRPRPGRRLSRWFIAPDRGAGATP